MSTNSDALAQRLRFVDPFQNQSGNLGGGANVGLPPNGSVFTTPQNTPQLPRLGTPIFPNPASPNFNPQAISQTGFPTQLGAVPTLDLQNSTPVFPATDPSRFQSQPFPLFPNAGNNSRVIVQPPAVVPQSLPQNLPQVNGGFGVTNPGFNTNLPNPGFGQPQFGAANNRWPYQGTGANWLPSIDWTWPRQQWDRFQNQFLPRVLERPRIRHTYLNGSNDDNRGNELDIHDTEFATTLTIPNFLQSQQPLRISPGFVASFWNGPNTALTGADLPNTAFGAYVAADHVTDLSKTAGLETNLTVGVYSDYDNFSSDALRVTGRLVGWQRINEYTVGKFGVEYFDRVRVKLLPVAGVFLSPNPDIKFDLAFPRSKLALRVPNVANREVWTYVGGEYGGGSWAIERIDGSDDQVDINDVRAFIGVEWIGPRRVTGFFDFGYAFERELVYRENPNDNLELRDTFMIRSGLAF